LTSVHNLAHGGDYTTESGSSIFGGGGFGAGSAPEEEKWASATVPYESNFTSYQPSQRYYPYPYVSVGNDGYEENASSTPRYEPAQGYQSYGGTTTYPASGYVVASTDCDGYVENTSSTSRPEQLQENQASGGATTYPASGTHRASTKHRKRYPTRWSEWEWGEKFQRYYRYRERSKGGWFHPIPRSISDMCNSQANGSMNTTNHVLPSLTSPTAKWWNLHQGLQETLVAIFIEL
jgi:hypothetical protein